MAELKIEFCYNSLGLRCILKAKTWNEVASELHDSGMVNVGEVTVYKNTYQLVSTEPQIINTDY